MLNIIETRLLQNIQSKNTDDFLDIVAEQKLNINLSNTDANGYTFLMHAILSESSYRIIRELINYHNIDINAIANDGNTALKIALSLMEKNYNGRSRNHKNASVLMLLLDHRDINIAPNIKNPSDLIVFLKLGYKKIFIDSVHNFRISNSEAKNILYTALSRGDNSVVKLIIQKNFSQKNINVKSYERRLSDSQCLNYMMQILSFPRLSQNIVFCSYVLAMFNNSQSFDYNDADTIPKKIPAAISRLCNDVNKVILSFLLPNIERAPLELFNNDHMKCSTAIFLLDSFIEDKSISKYHKDFCVNFLEKNLNNLNNRNIKFIDNNTKTDEPEPKRLSQ
tara:strand:+ start:2712 stop:3722 length:1011 start_codon:yes stop_codon:yes gene_type:complete